MKKIILFAAFVLISIAGFSQDLLSLKRGTKLEVIVTEITPTLVRYKLFSDPNGKVYFVYKDDVIGIKYKDGRVESFNQSDNQTVESINRQKEDIKENSIENQQSHSVIKNHENLETESQTSNNIKTQPDDVVQQDTNGKDIINLNNSEPKQSMTRYNGKGKDIVYLSNGDIIQGTITEQVPNRSLEIKTIDGNILTYQMDDIEKIVQGTINENYNSGHSSYGLGSGYKGIIDVGYSFGIGTYKMNRFDFNFINGYQVNPYFSLGIGVGLRYYFDTEAALIPIFADFRANFIDNPISPYLSLGIGYSFDATNSFESVGLLLDPTVGVSFKISDKSAFIVGLGYEMQRMKFLDFYLDNWTHIYEHYSTSNSGAVSIVVGISF